ncbi:hypothetical protein [Streptomyces cinereoruber]
MSSVIMALADYDDVGFWLLASAFLVAGLAVECGRVVIQGKRIDGGW